MDESTGSADNCLFAWLNLLSDCFTQFLSFGIPSKLDKITVISQQIYGEILRR